MSLSQKVSFIRDRCARAVVGLSGGLDSSVVVTLAVKALGKKNVYGYILPDSEITPEGDMKDALELAQALGINYQSYDLNLLRKLLSNIIADDRLTIGNALARLRMTILYAKAGEHKALVLGTSDRSEIEIGFFTKHGDGAADCYPIADLYKTEVRQFAHHLKVPIHIIEKPSSPALWAGQTAEGEIGLTYEQVDAMLRGEIEKHPALEARIRSTEHKRAIFY